MIGNSSVIRYSLRQFYRIPFAELSKRCSTQSTDLPSRDPVREVCTTGYSFATAAGRVSKYGVYWGRADPHNVICEVPGITHVAAMLMAMIDAVRVAKERGIVDKLIVYTDYNCPAGFRCKLETYASRDFHSYRGPKMKHAELLNELYKLTRDIDVSFRYRPSVKDKNPNYVIANILEDGTYKRMSFSRAGFASAGVKNGDEIDADGETPSTSSVGWPQVFTMAMFRPSKNGFTSASFATVWSDKRHGSDTMQRLAMVPATLFRAQLSAIEQSLREAVDNALQRVVVITDSHTFISNWKKKWLKANGSPAPNKFLYDRIRDLVNSGIEVRFRYETPNKESAEWTAAVDKCFESIDLPIIGKDRSEYDRDITEIIADGKLPEGSNTQRVRIFKSGTDFQSGFVWDRDDRADESVIRENNRVHRCLLDVLEKASSLGLRNLIIRTDSVRLVLSAENWLPFWHRNGWRNSLHKPIAKADLWKRIWTLKKTVKVYWELMDPPDLEDRQAAKRLAAKQ